MPYRNYFQKPRDFAKIKNENQRTKIYAELHSEFQDVLAIIAPIAWECKWFTEGRATRISLSLQERREIARYALGNQGEPWIPSREGKVKKPLTEAKKKGEK